MPDPRPRDGWGRVGSVDLTTTAILVIASVGSMLLYAISPSAFSRLVYFPDAVREGQLWRLVTWPIANPPTQFWVIITLAFFWFVGHAVEELVGKQRYLRLVVAVTIVPAVFVTLLPGLAFPTVPEVGLGLLASVMFVIFAAQYPQQPFFFGIPAWVLAAVFVGIDVLRLTGNRLWGTLILMVGAIVLGLVIVRQWGFVDRLAFIPRFSSRRATRLSSAPTRGPDRKGKSKRRNPGSRRTSGPTVVEGPWDAPSSSADTAAAHAELDALLDKISAGGLDSLTADEKRRLNELSKRLR